ncbi:uncharacterized protein APUU_51522S [Neofusicoccum parvum]|nr:uncharacterized protein APUU_51522S [Neofusicoccum parvum]
MATNPTAVLIRNTRQPGASTLKGPGATFTGDVWIDMAHRDPDTMIGNVMFTPCARTHWHSHERGQFIKVVAGSGWLCDRGAAPQRLHVGDVAWCPPGTVHWHGADDESYMMHFVVAHGKTEWMEPVSEEEYAKRK